jgi:hypothetical protein
VSAAVSLLGIGAVAATTSMGPSDANQSASPAAAAEAAEEVAPPLPRKNAVLVFGGTGKLGRRVVEKVGHLHRDGVLAGGGWGAGSSGHKTLDRRAVVVGAGFMGHKNTG